MRIFKGKKKKKILLNKNKKRLLFVSFLFSYLKNEKVENCFLRNAIFNGGYKKIIGKNY